MTVATTTSKSGPYAGAGTTGPFTVGFRFLDNSHLKVVRTSAAGVETILLLDTDYTVSGAGAASGTVTLVSALAVGQKLTIVRDVPTTQEADYVQNDAFPAQSHEDALDKLTMITQQLEEELGRSLKTSVSSPQTPDELLEELFSARDDSASSASAAAASASAAAASENAAANDAAEIAGALAQVAEGVKDRFVAGVDYTSGVTTTLTLSDAPLKPGSVSIYFSGVYQESVEYSIAGSVITFDAPISTPSVEILFDVGRSFAELDAAVAAAEADRVAAAASASAAAGSASAAAGSASAASTSASSAASSLSTLNSTIGDAVDDAVAAATAAAAASASAASGSASAALTSASNAASSATAAANSASNAASSASSSASSATAASGSASSAASSATSASNSASSAASSAASALNSPGTSATSTTSNVVNNDSPKSFTIQAGKSLVPGMFILAAATGALSNYVVGQVLSYNSTTGSLSLGILTFEGSGTFNNWTLSLTAKPSIGGADLFPVGGFAYVDKRLSVPSTFVKFQNFAWLERGLYPLLDDAIPAVPDSYARTDDAQVVFSPEDLTNDLFGNRCSISRSGNYFAVKNYQLGGAASKYYIYFFNGTNYVLQATITHPESAGVAEDLIRISDDHFVVSQNSNSTSSGKVHVFSRSGTTWSLQQTLTSPSPNASDSYGRALDIEGGRIVVGCPGYDTPNTNTGAVFVYLLSGGTWGLEQTIQPSTSSNQLWGYYVSLNGNYLGFSGSLPTSVPSVEIYKLSAGTWSQIQQLNVNVGQIPFSFALSENNLITFHARNSSTSDFIRVYNRISDVYSFEATITSGFQKPLGVNADFVSSFQLNRALDDAIIVSGAGRFHVAEKVAGVWPSNTLIGFYPGESTNAQSFGNSVDIAFGVAIVCAVGDTNGDPAIGSVSAIRKTANSFSKVAALPESPNHDTIVRVQ